MRSVQTPGAIGAHPPLETLQMARIAARVGVSASVASVMAGLAWGAGGRDHSTMLAGLTAERVGASMVGAQ